MNRALLIGRSLDNLQEHLQEHLEIETELARLPAAGLRQLDATPPDVILLADPETPRMITLCHAIRERPVGQLIPIIVLSNDPRPADLDLLGWLPTGHLPPLVALISQELEIPRKKTPTTFQTQSFQPNLQPVETPDYTLEEIDDWNDTPKLRTQDLFPHHLRPHTEELDINDVRKKLRIIRHEDYFAILGVPRGAETPVIRDAFQKQMTRFDPKNVAFEVAHALHHEILEIRDALEDAWAVLGDPKLRATYLERTTRR